MILSHCRTAAFHFNVFGLLINDKIENRAHENNY